jgi:hypothetical protein
VGAVTNRSGDEAEVETGYGTYSQFIRVARARALARTEERTDVASLAMFCCAMRREVYEAVGPMDERFKPALFEDDDYVLRVRALGYRVVCAEDVLVHHFGQATVGELAASGEYGGTFHANRRRFEQKWGLSWESHQRRRSERRQRFLAAVNAAVADQIPPGATVLVVSRGDDELLHQIAPTAAHFPQGADSRYAGYHPASGRDAVAHLEAMREAGASFLLLPSSEFWWLEHYGAFREHLEHHCELVYGDEQTCRLYSLDGHAAPVELSAVAAGRPN